MPLVLQGHVVIFKRANRNPQAPSVVILSTNVIYQNIALEKMSSVQMTYSKWTVPHVKWVMLSAMVEHVELIQINVNCFGARQGRCPIINVTSKTEKGQGMVIVDIID